MRKLIFLYPLPHSWNNFNMWKAELLEQRDSPTTGFQMGVECESLKREIMNHNF
jgi:hypothetical protein